MNKMIHIAVLCIGGILILMGILIILFRAYLVGQVSRYYCHYLYEKYKTDKVVLSEKMKNANCYYFE